MKRDDFVKKSTHGGLHGDIAVCPAKVNLSNARKTNSTVVALGEATGHNHAFANPKTTTVYEVPVVDVYEGQALELYKDLFGDFVKVAELSEPDILQHQEHGTIEFDPGVYIIAPQVEWVAGEARKVID